MTRINIIVPRRNVRRWQIMTGERLAAAGHDVHLIAGPGCHVPFLMDFMLKFGTAVTGLSGPRLHDRIDHVAFSKPGPADISIDLTAGAAGLSPPALRLVFNTNTSFTGLVEAVARDQLPDLQILLAGKPVAEARPMIDNRASLAHGVEDILARAVSLVATTTQRVIDGPLTPLDAAPIQPAKDPGLPHAFITASLPKMGREFLRRLTHRQAHWRTGYRFLDGDGVAETGDLSGKNWITLPDDGSRFYADPFAFEKDGKHYIFLEDLPHATGKAVISVSTLDASGVAGAPRPVLEEPHHLSYPQVFARDGAIWMLPESSAANQLVLYRASRFPDEWARHSVLIEGPALSDATLLEHEGGFWLFATDRDGAGSTSDMLVVYYADNLEGPWMAHPANPIMIDRRGARPGGAFIRTDGRILLPVQDGTNGYGGGLGLSELRQLDRTKVDLAPPRPILAEGFWPYPMIHTLNRAGRLEVTDGIAQVRKKRSRASSGV